VYETHDFRCENIVRNYTHTNKSVLPFYTFVKRKPLIPKYFHGFLADVSSAPLFHLFSLRNRAANFISQKKKYAFFRKQAGGLPVNLADACNKKDAGPRACISLLKL
jgi:hypothetical protein